MVSSRHSSASWITATAFCRTAYRVPSMPVINRKPPARRAPWAACMSASPFAQVAAVDRHVAVLGQLPPAQLPLGDALERGPVQEEGFNARLGRRPAVDEALEHAPADAHDA